MIKKLEELVFHEMDTLSKYALEQDKIFNKYIVLGCAASLTLIINLVSKNPKFFDDSQCMDWALWGFAIALVMSTGCIFVNARLADSRQLRAAKVKGFLSRYQSQSNDSDRLSDVALGQLDMLLSEKEQSTKRARNYMIFFEASSGVIFCVGIFISVIELSKLI